MRKAEAQNGPRSQEHALCSTYPYGILWSQLQAPEQPVRLFCAYAELKLQLRPERRLLCFNTEFPTVCALWVLLYSLAFSCG